MSPSVFAEEKELQLRAGIESVAELGQPLDLAQEDDTRIALEQVAIRLVDPADDAGSRVASPLPGDDVEGREVGHQEHVALGDPGEAGDRRAIKPLAVLDDILEEVDRDRHQLGDAHHVSELEADELDRLALAGFQHLIRARRNCPPAGWCYLDCHLRASLADHTRIGACYRLAYAQHALGVTV